MAQTVLIIEDDRNIADLLRIYLEKDGFSVQMAADGGSAAELAGARHGGRRHRWVQLR